MDRAQVHLCAPTELHLAALKGDQNLAAQILKQEPSQLYALNEHQDTPLAVALNEGQTSLALQLIEIMDRDQFFHQNNEGESYIFLASQMGQVEVIRALAQRYYNSLGALEIYDFSKLDPRNKLKQRALFVAKNRAVVDALETEYYRGYPNLRFWKFLLKVDESQKIFLHTAAHDGRSDVIDWLVEKKCIPNSFQTQESRWFFHYPSEIVAYGRRGLNTYIGDFGVPFDTFFNRKDKNGDTPFQIALRGGQADSARSLAGCRWIDFDSVNKLGDLGLHTFLKSTSEDHDLLDFLVEQQTLLRPLFTKSRRINHRNLKQDSALHLAAVKDDPYFYKALAKYGDIHSKNAAGISAQTLFNNHQREINAQ